MKKQQHFNPDQIIFHIFRHRLGMDEDNNSSVAIKFAKPGPAAKRLENEYRHYLLLDAEGNEIHMYLTIFMLKYFVDESNFHEDKTTSGQLSIHF